MKKSIAVLGLMLLIAGCHSETTRPDLPKIPPELRFIYQDIRIEPVLAINQWDGIEVVPNETLVTFMDKYLVEDLVYVKNGESMEIQINGSLPDEMSLTEVIVGQDGGALYTYREEKLLPLEVTKEGIRFIIEDNMAAMLSSQSSTYEPGGLLRGYKLSCSWGDHVCVYGFVVKSDVGFTSSAEVISETMSEEVLGELQNELFDVVIEEDLLPLQSAWVSKDEDGIAKIFLEIREEEGVDEEAYRKIIFDLVGYEFPLVLELIPFPTDATFHGLVYETDKVNDFDQKGFIGKVLIFSTESILSDHSPDAVWATITDKTDLVDQNGRPMTFDLIEQGMTVSNYYRGMTYTTYPGHQGSERLVVDTSVLRESDGVMLSEPVVFGEGGIINGDKGYIISLEMTEATYLWGENKDGWHQSGWLGTGHLILSHKDQLIDSYDLSKEWPQGLYIEGSFTIYTEDYDKNGVTEILIGQALDNKSYGYHLYGVSDEGIFRYGGYDPLNLSADYDQRYSRRFTEEEMLEFEGIYRD